MATINEVITKFSFVGSLKPQQSFNANLRTSIKSLAGFAVGVKAAVAVLALWESSITESIDPMVQLNRETGVSISYMQEMGYAASQNGSGLDAVTKSIRELTKRAGEFSRTGGGPAAEAFLQMGLRVRDANGHIRTADQLMDSARVKLQRFNRSEQIDLLDKLGIDPSMIQLMNQSGDAIDGLRQRAIALGTITAEQGDDAAALNDANTTLRYGLHALRNTIAVGLAPAFKEMTDGFVDFLITNRELIRNGVTKLTQGLMALGHFIDRMVIPVLAIAGAFGAWALATGGLDAALAVLFAPLTLIAAAVAAIILVVDDLIVAFQGGDSVIRDLFKSWTGFDLTPALRRWVGDVKQFFSSIGNAFSTSFDGLGDILAGEFTSGFKKIWDGTMIFLNAISDAIGESFRGIGKLFSAILPDWVKDRLGISDDAPPPVSQTEQPGIYPYSSDLGHVMGMNTRSMAASASNAISSRTPGANAPTGNVSVQQNNQITVQTNDPIAAANRVGDVTNRDLRQTRQYFGRGGR